MKNYKGWKIETGIGNGTLLPQEYHHNIYVDPASKTIYKGDLLSQGWDEYDHCDIRIATVCRPHPYFGKPTYITRDELITLAEEAMGI